MTAMFFAVAVFGITDGWLADNPALIIGGFMCLLVGVSLVFYRDAKANHDAIYGQRFDNRLRAGMHDHKREDTWR